MTTPAPGFVPRPNASVVDRLARIEARLRSMQQATAGTTTATGGAQLAITNPVPIARALAVGSGVTSARTDHAHTSSLANQQDVAITAPAGGNVLAYNGAQWANIPQPGRIPVGGQYRITTITTPNSNAETAIVTTNALPLAPNSLYLITFQAQMSVSTSTPERWIQRIRSNNLSGAQLAVLILAPATDPGEPISTVQQYLYTTTAAENTGFCGTWARDTSNAATTATASTLSTLILVEQLVFLAGAAMTTA